MATKEKAAPKKAAAKKEVKKVATAGKPVGKLVAMTIANAIKAIKDGTQRAFNANGKPLPIGYLSKMADHKKEIQVTLVKIG